MVQLSQNGYSDSCKQTSWHKKWHGLCESHHHYLSLSLKYSNGHFEPFCLTDLRVTEASDYLYQPVRGFRVCLLCGRLWQLKKGASSSRDSGSD